MAEEWGSYFCNVNDKLASIALDLSLNRDAPIRGKSWLLWVWVYLRSPRPDGLSDRTEFEVISAIEDELTKRISNACDAVEAGRLTTAGRREFYFYGASEKTFESAVSEAMSLFETYKFDMGSKEDAEWGQYLNVLCPSEEDFEKMKNQDLLGVLMKHGDTLTPVRDVRHWVYFQSREDRLSFASAVIELGYKIECESDLENDDRPFELEITREQSITPDQIDATVITLFRLAKRANGEYDGWETEAIRDEH